MVIENIKDWGLFGYCGHVVLWQVLVCSRTLNNKDALAELVKARIVTGHKNYATELLFNGW